MIVFQIYFRVHCERTDGHVLVIPCRRDGSILRQAATE